MKKNDRWKVTITDKREDECQICFAWVFGYDAKFGDGFTAFLCKECLDKQIDRRKQIEEECSRDIFQEENRDAERRTA